MCIRDSGLPGWTTFITWITWKDDGIPWNTWMDNLRHLDYLDGGPSAPGLPGCRTFATWITWMDDLHYL
eukprot:7056689-Karenia_brevis.AAC.1